MTELWNKFTNLWIPQIHLLFLTLLSHSYGRLIISPSNCHWTQRKNVGGIRLRMFEGFWWKIRVFELIVHFVERGVNCTECKSSWNIYMGLIYSSKLSTLWRHEAITIKTMEGVWDIQQITLLGVCMEICSCHFMTIFCTGEKFIPPEILWDLYVLIFLSQSHRASVTLSVALW